MKTKSIMMFGAKSTEHDISVITACLMQKEEYAKIYIDRAGIWRLIQRTVQPAEFVSLPKKSAECVLLPHRNVLYLRKRNRLVPLYNVDYALLCFHGGGGEQGEIQGLLRSCGIAYSGCDNAASALCFDKGLCKIFLQGLDLPLLSGYVAQKGMICEYEYPVVVKPCRSGSSIGIGYANCAEELKTALDTAYLYDTRVLVEEKLENAVDLNIAVLKTENGYVTSDIEQPNTAPSFYSFDDKYLAGSKNGEVRFIEHPKSTEITHAAVKIASALSSNGVIRIDILSNGDNYYVNEINTIPGSLAYHLFANQFSKEEFLEIIRQGASDRQSEENQLTAVFTSSVLSATNFSAKK